MALSSRKKRRAFRNPKRVRRGGSTGFNVAVAVIIIVGTALVLVSRHPNSAGAVGPKLRANGNSDHWHAAIGVNVCGVWQPGPIWPHTDGQTLTRADSPTVYAGLHTHQLTSGPDAGKSDGIIHMEPAVTSESGRNATVGKWMEYGGWHLDETSMKLWPGATGKTINEKNGDKCKGEPGELRWALGQFTQGKKTTLKTQGGNPAHYKLYNDNVVAIYFEPKGADLSKLGPVPSEVNLPDAANNESTPTTMPGVVPTTPGATTTAPKAGSSTTAPSASTTTPPTTAATSTTKP
jgi:hypothetical protein